MADIAESSSSSSSKLMKEKPVVVRVKRKASQLRLDGFWLEITERPLKRSFLDFGKLSISSLTAKEELKSKKIFVQHVKTARNSEATIDILQSFMPDSSEASGFKAKIEERRFTFKQENRKQDQLLSRARQKHEVLAKNARFEQIWKSRKGNKGTMPDDSLREICHLYDVVRVDVEEETSNEVEEREDTSLEDSTILCNYLPLIREFLPSAAAEIESDIQAYRLKQASTDEHVYDLYTTKDNLNATDDASTTYPLVQVGDDEDFYDGSIQSEFESDDSNAEDNPLNDYPDEETCEDEELESSSHNESEELESSISGGQSEEAEDKTYYKMSEDEDTVHKEEVLVGDDYDDDDGDDDDDDSDDDNDTGEDWRWAYR